MGLRTCSAAFGSGTAGRFGGWNDQNCRSSSETSGSLSRSTTSFSRGGPSGAPAAIQRRTLASSPSVIERTENLSCNSAGGMSPDSMRLISRLPAGSPGISAGPDRPPLTRLTTVRRSSPPSCLRLPWQAMQRSWKIGRMSCSVRGPLSPPEAVANSAAFAGAPLSIHRRRVSISSPVSFPSPGGIVFETTLSRSKLPAEAPTTSAGPDLPPCKIEALVRRSSPACGLSFP